MQSWAPDLALARRAEIVDIFQRAFGYSDERAERFAETFSAGLGYDGALVLAAVESEDTDAQDPVAGRLLGFAFGFTFRRGQWWPEMIGPALDSAGLQDWYTDAFELVEIEVDPAEQGRGVGSALLAELGAQTAHRTILLGTSAAADNRAPALYQRFGFVDLLPGFRYPNGVAARIMGADLQAR